jgi:hypothetical protein
MKSAGDKRGARDFSSLLLYFPPWRFPLGNLTPLSLFCFQCPLPVEGGAFSLDLDIVQALIIHLNLALVHIIHFYNCFCDFIIINGKNKRRKSSNYTQDIMQSLSNLSLFISTAIPGGRFYCSHFIDEETNLKCN